MNTVMPTDRNELWDTSNGEPCVNGVLVVDGEIILVHGVEWLATREASMTA